MSDFLTTNYNWLYKLITGFADVVEQVAQLT